MNEEEGHYGTPKPPEGQVGVMEQPPIVIPVSVEGSSTAQQQESFTQQATAEIGSPLDSASSPQESFSDQVAAEIGTHEDNATTTPQESFSDQVEAEMATPAEIGEVGVDSLLEPNDHAKEQDMAEAEDPFRSIIANTNAAVERGEVSERVAKKIIDKQSKLAEKASTKAESDFDSREKRKARMKDEREEAAGTLALEITEAIKHDQTSIEVGDHLYRGPGEVRSRSRVAKEDVFKSSLKFLGVKPEQVASVTESMVQGMYFEDPDEQNKWGFDYKSDQPMAFSEIENPDGSTLLIWYSRPRVDEKNVYTPSSIRISVKWPSIGNL